ncbi:MAG: aminotransferase class V-fold PLP-dependent enzyme [Candidatus Gastranaerophilales bacterium]|nr:aminotransferase class V-fold PLP-dependent enzyme [Candidatus Gastranaerophilales bacterium]
MTIRTTTEKISKSDRKLFTTPSHDRDNFIVPNCKKIFGNSFYEYDLSEVNGLDNLGNPENSIMSAMKKSAELLGVKSLFYLINGSSSGIIASMLSFLREKDKVLIARNCHQSVLNGLILTGAEPVWILPELNSEWEIFDPVSPSEIEKKLIENKTVKAVIITSPTYEGVTSDIKAIAEVCHKYNKILIVDEAHGALKSFYPEVFGENAVKLGADIAIQSLHKTCGAPNPCAVMLCGENVCPENIQNSLNLINTTSPSFPMIMAIEETINYLASPNGKKQISRLVSDIRQFKNEFQNDEKIQFCDFNDETKILVKITGMSGYNLSDSLFENFNIEDELTNNRASLLLTGLGTTKQKLKKLGKALKKIACYPNLPQKPTEQTPYFIPKMQMSLKNAYFSEKEEVSAENSIGKICGEIISEYPPGIPVLLAGEKIRKEHIEFLKNKKETIQVIKNR